MKDKHDYSHQGQHCKRSYKIDFWNLTETKISHFHALVKNPDYEAFIASLRKMEASLKKPSGAYLSRTLIPSRMEIKIYRKVV